MVPTRFFANTEQPISRSRSLHSPLSPTVDGKLESLLNAVQYLQEQTDQAISLGDQTNRAIGEVITRMDAFDSRIKLLESSSGSSQVESDVKSANKVPKDISVRFVLTVIIIYTIYYI